MISVLLEEKGKTQAELARFLNTKQSTVSGWINAGRVPSSDVLLPICEFFDITPNRLLGGSSTQGDNKSSPSDFSEDELKVISLWRKLDDDGRTLVMARLIEESRRVKDDTMIPPAKREAI